MAKSNAGRNTTTSGALSRRYGGHATAILNSKRYIKPLAKEKRGAQRYWAILKPLPELTEFAAMQALVFTTTVDDVVESAYGDVQELADEMGNWRDNLEEKFSSTQKYSDVSDAADALENVANNKPAVPEAVRGIRFVHVPSTKLNSRADRLSEAQDALSGAVSELNDWLADEQNADHAARDEVQDVVEQLENDADEMSAVSFPGMYG